jgi:hypothetical protein
MEVYKNSEPIINDYITDNILATNKNTLFGVAYRLAGRHIWVEDAHITANNETKNLNIFKVNGSVTVINQWAEITEITALTNCTNVYADLWDGTNSVQLTSPGADFSNLSLGSFFKKSEDSTQQYSISNADECRVLEPSSKEISVPFIVTQKTSADTYIRFNFTTNTVLDFKMSIWFEYMPVDGGTLTLV